MAIIVLMALIGLIAFLPKLLVKSSYESQLEKYIVGNDPKDITDVERLTREYDQKLSESNRA